MCIHVYTHMNLICTIPYLAEVMHTVVLVVHVLEMLVHCWRSAELAALSALHLFVLPCVWIGVSGGVGGNALM